MKSLVFQDENHSITRVEEMVKKMKKKVTLQYMVVDIKS